MVNREEIEYKITNMYTLREDEFVQYIGRDIGQVSMKATAEKWYTLFHASFYNLQSELSLNLRRERPMILMYFQKKGTSAFKADQTFFIPEHSHSLNYLEEFRSIYNLSKGSNIEHLCIKIEPHLFLETLMDTGDDDIVYNFLRRQEGLVTMNAPRHFTPMIHQSLYDLINNPYKGGLGKCYRENIVRNLLVHQLAVFCNGEKAFVPEDSKLHKKDIDLLHDIKNYLDQHFLEVNSLQDLSRKFCINSFKLKYGFKKLFDTPVMKYIDEQKMQYARLQLQYSDIDIVDLADELGYNHQNNFTTAFKRKFGYTPAMIR